MKMVYLKPQMYLPSDMWPSNKRRSNSSRYQPADSPGQVSNEKRLIITGTNWPSQRRSRMLGQRPYGGLQGSGKRKEQHSTVAAIQSLDYLNDQIVQYIFSPKLAQNDSLTEREKRALTTSMGLMRKLLEDAQGKFRKMMEDNERLATRIDSGMKVAQREVDTLRAELADTNKRLSQIVEEQQLIQELAMDTATLRESRRNEGADTSSSSATLQSDGHGISGGVPDTENSTTKVHHSVIDELEYIDNVGIDEVKANECKDNEEAHVDRHDERKETLGVKLDESHENSDSGCGSLTRRLNRASGDSSLSHTTQEERVSDQEEKITDGETEKEDVGNESTVCVGNAEEYTGTTEVVVNKSGDNDAEQSSSDHEITCSSEQRLSDNVFSEGVVEQTSHIEDDDDVRGRDEVHPSCYEEMSRQVSYLEGEVTRARDALHSVKSDRKRLKVEKLDLLQQMKQLYGMLEDKDQELRDFIRNYEQRMEQTNTALTELASEKEHSEREKLECMEQVRISADRYERLRLEYDRQVAKVRILEEELKDVRRDSALGDTPTGSYTTTSNSSSNVTTPSDQQITSSLAVPLQHIVRVRSHSAEHVNKQSQPPHAAQSMSSLAQNRRRQKRDSRFGSLSRLFYSKREKRKSLDPHLLEAAVECSSLLTPGSERLSYILYNTEEEKIELLEQCRTLPMFKWKATHVVLWLECILSMPMYVKICCENIKSGKVLLGLTDAELESGLGISNSMHKKKLRLAVESHRNPLGMTHPKTAQMDHLWVSDVWVPELGLAQHSHTFRSQLVDGRMLETLTKRELEKHLQVTRKNHQQSIFYGIKLLRSLRFDKEVLTDRRHNCESADVDLIVWTNQRVVKWVQSIDLHEYADNLRDSGVHGAMIVLEPSFDAGLMAAALGIPSTKHIIRRHLSSELDTILTPARSSLEQAQMCTGNIVNKNVTKHLNRSLTDTDQKTRKPGSLRGSIGKAFSKRPKNHLETSHSLDVSVSSPALGAAGGEGNCITPSSTGISLPDATSSGEVAVDVSSMDHGTYRKCSTGSSLHLESTAV